MATFADLDELYNIELSAFPQNRQASREVLADRMKLFGKGFFVLLVDGKIVAFSTALLLSNANSLEAIDKTDKEVNSQNGKIYYLRSLAVGKENQSKGYGKLLIAHHLKNAKKMKSERVVFTCVPEVEEYYVRLGFTRLTDFKPFHGNSEALWEVPKSIYAKTH